MAKTILAPTALISGPAAIWPNGLVRNITPSAADSTLVRSAAGVRVVMTVKIGAPVVVLAPGHGDSPITPDSPRVAYHGSPNS